MSVRQLQTAILVALMAALLWPSLCMGKAFSGPGRSLQLESKLFGSTEFVPLVDLAESLGLGVSWYYESRLIELRNASISIDFMVGSRYAVFDKKTTAVMSSGISLIKGEPFIPASFLTATLKPYYSRWGATDLGNSRIIVLDPGHGGDDPGTMGRGLVEKTLTLDVARLVRTILVAKGYKVRMTRDADVFVPRQERAEFANNLGAAVLVCIHGNSVENNVRAITGSETFYLTTVQKADNDATERLESSGMQNEVHSGWSALTARLKRFFLGNHLKETRNKSVALARAVQARVSVAAVGDNRGIKPKNLEVLRYAFCPACLTEIGFISNPTDASFLHKDWYRQKIAEAVAQGIIDYLDAP